MKTLDSIVVLEMKQGENEIKLWTQHPNLVQIQNFIFGSSQLVWVFLLLQKYASIDF